MLLKPSGAACNLACAYCFYLDRKGLYPKGSFRMSEQVLEAYLRQRLATGGEVEIAWQGGEPTLLGLDFFRHAVAMAARLAPPGTTVRHTLQTNGVLLDDAWCAFLREHRFLVGLSLDGPRALHDAFRVDAAGRPTFDAVMRALARLRAHDVELNVLTAVHSANAGHAREVYRFLRDDAGARYIQYVPVVEREGDWASARSVRPDAWGRFLVDTFEEWIGRDVGRVFVQLFDAALASWVGEPTGMCVFSETCGGALALEHTGDLYACDHFVDPAHRLGNVLRDDLAALVGDARQRRFGDAKRDGLPQACRACDVRFACHGECPKNRFRVTPDGEPGLNWLCEGYRAFFTHVDGPMRFMATMLRRGLAPAFVMRWYAEH